MKIESMQLGTRGAVFKNYRLTLPVIFEKGVHSSFISAYRVYMNDTEIKALVKSDANPDWDGISIGYSELMELSFHTDDKWAKMLIDFQNVMYDVVPAEPRDVPTIRCSRNWFRKFVKFYDDRHPISYQYEPKFRIFINSAPIEVEEGEGIWAQYQVDRLIVASRGYEVWTKEVKS